MTPIENKQGYPVSYNKKKNYHIIKKNYEKNNTMTEEEDHPREVMVKERLCSGLSWWASLVTKSRTLGLGGTQKEEPARDEGEPIGSGLLDNDTVDQVVKPFESYGLKFTVRWWSGSA